MTQNESTNGNESDEAPQPKWTKVKAGWDWTKHKSSVAFALIYIVNGVAIGLTAFDFVHPPYTIAAVFGSLSIAFATVQLATMVDSGVKYQTTSSNKRRK